MRLRHVVGGNAATAADANAGGAPVTLIVTYRTDEFRPRLTFLAIRRTDTGVGPAADDLGRVFDRFYRSAGQPRRSSGSGIGLTIARDIARAHGGDVTATPPGPGCGATFILTLPLRASGAEMTRAAGLGLRRPAVRAGLPPERTA
jgi:signal transduction histidine kinase